jgi:hypothetical protein
MPAVLIPPIAVAALTLSGPPRWAACSATAIFVLGSWSDVHLARQLGASAAACDFVDDSSVGYFLVGACECCDSRMAVLSGSRWDPLVRIGSCAEHVFGPAAMATE